MGRRGSILGGLLVVTGILLAPGRGAGQDPEVPFTVWGLEEGLSHPSIRAMVQDSAGVLWFGTQRGLNRFDGRSFGVTLADPARPRGPTDDYFHSLAVAEGGRLWLGTQSGLELYDPSTRSSRPLSVDRHGSWPPLVASDSAGIERVGRLVPLPDGAVLALVEGNGPLLTLVTLTEDGHRATRILGEAGPPRDVCLTADGVLATVGAGRVVRLDRLGRTLGDLPSAPDTLRTLVCDDEVLGATMNGRILRFEGGGWREIGQLSAAGGLASGEADRGPPAVRDIAELGDSLLWLATDQGLLQLDRRTGATTPFPVGGDGELPHPEVYDLLVDRTGVTWVGTWNGLAAVHPLVRATERATTDRELPSSGGVLSVLPLPGGGTLVGLDGGGLVRLERTGSGELVGRRIPEAAGLDALSVYSLAREADGTVWIGTWEDGVHRWTPGRTVEGIPYEAPGGPSQGVLVDARGDVWAAARALGLTRLDRAAGVFRVVAPSPANDSWYYWSTAQDPEGGLWAGATFDGLHHVGPGGEVRRVDAALPSDRILTVTRARDGRIWMGTEGDGLIRYDPDTDSVRVWTVSDGLPHDNVQRIIEDPTGKLWVSTNDGVALFAPDSGAVFTLRRRHGLAGNRFFANSGTLTPDGNVVLGGPDGVTVLDPAAIRSALASARPSNVTLTRFSLLGRDTTLAAATGPGGLDLEHDQNFFSFEFAATDYTDPSLNRYEYRLDPLDDDWRDAGSTPVGTYTSVPPGRYTFEVRAGNSYGVWTPEPALVIPVVVHPAFWQTLWFQALGVVAAAALLASFFRYRYEQIAARARLRLDIAGKLHDDIGADLSTIALKTELVRATAALDERRARQLAAASRLARETAHRVRETVWLVNTQYDTLPGLVAKLRDTADVMLSGQVRYDFVEPGTIPDQEVGMEIRQHVHLLFKETLNNLLKHAGARHVHIEVATTSRELRFEVRDDGVGFDPDGPEGGSGQRLMRERARAAHGSVEVRSAPGEGTRVTFRGRLR